MTLRKIRNTDYFKGVRRWLALTILLASVIGVVTVLDRGSIYADTSGTIRVRVFSNAPSAQTPISGAAGQVFTIIPCNGSPFTIHATTNASGIYTYAWPAGCGAGGMDAIFCTDPQLFTKAGYSMVSVAVDAGNSNTGSSGICGSLVGAGGLLSFTATMTPNPSLDFSANTTSITKGGSAVLNWGSANATSCNATSGNLNTAGAKSGSQSVQPTQTTTYTIRCDKSGTPSTTKSVTIDVTSASASTPNTKKTTPSSKPDPTTKPTAGAVEDKTPPNALKKLTASSSRDGVLISWTKPEATDGVVKYIIERSEDRLTWEQLSAEHTATAYDDDTAVAGTYYFYRVSAVDSAGNQSEVAITEAVLAAATDEEDDAPKTVATVNDRQDGPSPLAFIGAILLGFIALAGGGMWWFRRRAATQLSAGHGYDAPSSPTQTAQPVTLLDTSNGVMHPPVGPAQQATPHTSMSLKDMVLQDYHPDSPNNQPKPPRPPQA